MANVNDGLNALNAQIQIIMEQLQSSEVKRAELEQRVENMDQGERANLDRANISDECNLPDIEPNLTSGDQIQLESYKSIPEFNGKQHEYRSWRNQVARRMKIIHAFTSHPKYEAALAIVRAKITGTAADVLTNNKTPYNIICILKTLDEAYIDQRPLYAIEAQMVSIKQNDKNLHQFYNAINFALNAIISKVVMTYKIVEEQRSLIAEAQKKAIRTFIVGLKFRTARHILYGQQPKTLSEAYTIAQTVFYDNEHLQLEQYTTKIHPQHQAKIYTNVNKPRYEWNQQRNNNNVYNTPEPMEIDASNRTKQTNWRQPVFPQKREYISSRQRFEQPCKMQKINSLMEQTTQPILRDLTSNDDSNDSTNTNLSSAFLDE